MTQPAAAAPSAPANPFIGVQPYPEGRALYGREQESAELADLIISRRLVLLYSPSGAGKTSLINTALRRELAVRGKGRFRMSKAIRVGYQPEGIACNRYVLSALRHLEKSFPERQQLTDTELAAYTLPRYLAERSNARTQTLDPKARRDLLFFDQFEELFTLDPTDIEAKREFLSQLAEVLGNREEDDDAPARGGLRWALFAMREDLIAELDPYKLLLPTALATRYRLNLLTRPQAERVILCTAADGGAEFGEDAIRMIVNDLARVRAPRGAPGEWVAGEYVEPVHLQVVCYRLWDRHIRDGQRHLRPEDLAATTDGTDPAGAAGADPAGAAAPQGCVAASPGESSKAGKGRLGGDNLGAVDDALAWFYSESVRKAAGDSTTRERSIRDWIEGSLVSRAKLRASVMLDPSTPLPVRDAELAVLGGTLLRKETRGGRDWLELTHDRLIDPLLWSNNRWRGEHLSLLQMQAHLWHAAGRADGFLLTGDALESSAKWASTHDHELSQTDREFLAEALKQRDNERAAKRSRVIRTLGTVAGVIALLVTGAGLKLYRLNVDLDQSNDQLTTQKQAAEAQTIAAQQQSAMSGIRFNLSEADVLRRRDPIGSIRSALVSDGQLSLLGQWGAAPSLIAPERITVEASLLDSLRQAPPVLVRYTGHAQAVRRVLFAPGGRALTASYDGTLQLWDADDGRRVAQTPPAERPVFAVALDAKRGVIADGDGLERIRLWRLAGDRFEPLATIGPEDEKKPARITGLALIADGTVLVASLWDRRIVFFDITTPESPRRYATVRGGAAEAVVYDIAASADGRMLATAGRDGTVGVWRNPPTPQRPDAAPEIVRLETDSSPDRAAINAVAFSPDGRYLAAGGRDGAVFVWEMGAGMARSMRRLAGEGGHEGTVFGLAFDAASSVLASTAADRRVILWPMADVLAWNRRDALPLGDPFPALPERLFAAAFRPDRPATLALAGGPSVFLVDADQPVSPLAEKLPALHAATGGGRWQAMAVAADASVVAASRGDEVAFWSPRPDRRFGLRASDAIYHPNLSRAVMDAAGALVVTGSRDGEVRAWRVGNGEGSTRLAAASQQRVIALAVSADGRLAAASLGAEIRVWRIAADGTAALLAREPLGDRRARALAFDAAAGRLAAGTSDGSVRLWRIGANGLERERDSRTVQPSEINVIAFSTDGTHLATGAEDSTLAYWQVPTLDVEREFREHRSGVVSLAFCARDGAQRLFSSDREGEVFARLSLNDLRHTRALLESSGRPRYIAVTPDCRRLAASGTEPTVWSIDAEFVRAQACLLGSAGDEALAACDPVRKARTR